MDDRVTSLLLFVKKHTWHAIVRISKNCFNIVPGNAYCQSRKMKASLKFCIYKLNRCAFYNRIQLFKSSTPPFMMWTELIALTFVLNYAPCAYSQAILRNACRNPGYGYEDFVETFRGLSMLKVYSVEVKQELKELGNKMSDVVELVAKGQGIRIIPKRQW